MLKNYHNISKALLLVTAKQPNLHELWNTWLQVWRATGKESIFGIMLRFSEIDETFAYNWFSN